MPTTGFTCFVDESGNAGPNLVEASQPVFVHAALVVPAPVLDEARALVVDLHRRFLSGAAEVHVGILNQGPGRTAIATLLPKLAALGIVPVLSVMERRCVHAAYVVDTCFDKEWNPLAQPRFLSSSHARQVLTESLLNVVGETLLRDFAAAFRARDETAMVVSVSAMADALERGQHPLTARTIRGAIPTVAEQCDEIRGVDAQATAMNTINASSFAALQAMCERTAEAAELDGGTILHDRSPQAPAYRTMFDLGRRMSMAVGWENGQMNVPLRRITAFEEGDSKDEPLLQLADVVAGMFRRLTATTQPLRDAAFDEWLMFAGMGDGSRSNLMISKQLLARVWDGPLQRRANRQRAGR